VILPDTSAWVELLRGTGSPVHRQLQRLLDRRADIAVTEPVVFELLAGVGSDRRAAELRAQLLGFPLIPLGGLAGFEEAATIYRACAAGGEQVRRSVDCLIAAPAIRASAAVLHIDRDFDAIARHTPLRIEPVLD